MGLVLIQYTINTTIMARMNTNNNNNNNNNKTEWVTELNWIESNQTRHCSDDSGYIASFVHMWAVEAATATATTTLIHTYIHMHSNCVDQHVNIINFYETDTNFIYVWACLCWCQCCTHINKGKKKGRFVELHYFILFPFIIATHLRWNEIPSTVSSCRYTAICC